MTAEHHLQEINMKPPFPLKNHIDTFEAPVDGGRFPAAPLEPEGGGSNILPNPLEGGGSKAPTLKTIINKTRKGDALRNRNPPIHRNLVCYLRQNNVIYLYFE